MAEVEGGGRERGGMKERRTVHVCEYVCSACMRAKMYVGVYASQYMPHVCMHVCEREHGSVYMYIMMHTSVCVCLHMNAIDL